MTGPTFGEGVHGVGGQPATPHPAQLLLGHGVVVPEGGEHELGAEGLPQQVGEVLEELQLDVFVQLSGVVRESVPGKNPLFTSHLEQKQSRDDPPESIILTPSSDVSQIEYLLGLNPRDATVHFLALLDLITDSPLAMPRRERNNGWTIIKSMLTFGMIHKSRKAACECGVTRHVVQAIYYNW
ncbi:hypothetical protein TcasGA2_TC011426 [Tribolium castaneum]|uniref:Uncharacterized protein n=1 Tax=Tribolium castaneum TaxID=7070 RepID=D6X4K7_TRICA|nr:hypothetical protein TcasGA2_TC011426 [Tribolium castaneum]